MVSGDRPNLMLAQVQDFCPGPGQDLTWTGPGPDLGPGMGPGMGPGPELDNILNFQYHVQHFHLQLRIKKSYVT